MKSFGRRKREQSEDGRRDYAKEWLTRAPRQGIRLCRDENVVNRWLAAIISELERKTLPKVSNRRMPTKRHGSMPANVCDSQSSQVFVEISI